MLERIKARFLRKTPQGRLDIRATVQNLVVETRSVNELTTSAYLETLNEQDRAHVQDFLSYAEVLHQSLNGVDLAVTAAGSSVRSEAQRHQPMGDIDLRVLNSAPVNSELRQNTVDFIRDSIRGYLQSTGVKFEEDKATEETNWVKESRGDMVPFLDWYNNDPSFTVNYPEGHPLHFSISGVDNFDLQKYLRIEREHNGYFVVLYTPTQTT